MAQLPALWDGCSTWLPSTAAVLLVQDESGITRLREIVAFEMVEDEGQLTQAST